MRQLKYLVIILLFSISALAQTKSLVTASQPVVDFGFVSGMGEYGRKITLKSNVNDTLRLGRIDTYCECITASYSSDIIYPGDSIIVELKFRPQKLIGKIYKVTHIYDESNRRLAKLTVQATIYKSVSNFITYLMRLFPLI